MALAYLRTNKSRGYNQLLRDDISLEQLALDCISSLFVLDTERKFSIFEQHYNEIDWMSLGDSELNASTHRIVFSAVSQHIFGGNLKLTPTFQERVHLLWVSLDRNYPNAFCHRNGTVWISCKDCDEFLPIMPPEIMESKLRNTIRKTTDTRHLILSLLDVLQLQFDYRKEMPFPEVVYIVDTRMKMVRWEKNPLLQPYSREEGPLVIGE